MKKVKATMTIDKAIETIKDYCVKHTECAKCPFYIKGDCEFEKGILPCDWKMGKRSDNNAKT